MNQFMDLIQTPSVVFPIFFTCLTVLIALVLAIYFWPDENDRKLEREEKTRAENLARRMEHNDKPAQTLEDFYQKYDQEDERPSAQDRMSTLSKPAEVPYTAWMRELLIKYQFAMKFDAGGNRARLTDSKFEELRNKEVRLDMSRVVGANYQEFKTLLIHARSTINRRAQRAGIIPIKTRKVESEVINHDTY